MTLPEPNELENPPRADSVLIAIGDEADAFRLRPLMTGDVLRREDGTLVALVQHPCAIRSNGVTLLERLLTCEVVPLNPDGVRSSWAKEPFYRMSLTQFDPPVQIDFRRPVVLASSEAQQLPRVALMDRAGVNLLMQRWVHHNTRFVAKTVAYDEMCAGPHAEVDLTYEALADLVDAGMDEAEALAAVDEFLGRPLSAAKDDTWRDRLKDPQNHSAARRALDDHVRRVLADQATV